MIAIYLTEEIDPDDFPDIRSALIDTLVEMDISGIDRIVMVEES